MVLAYDAVDGKSLDRLEPSALTDDVLGGDLGADRRAPTSTASPTATSGWRTSSSPATARCG